MKADPYHAEASEGALRATFHGEGRMPKCQPDPAYPNGKDADLAPGFAGCSITLPLPTPCCGHWLITCTVCGCNVIVTAAARPDDPRTIRIPCRTRGNA